jgi:hypothetical protein
LLAFGSQEKLGIYVQQHEENDSFISGDAFKKYCDFVYEKATSFDPFQVQEGNLVFVDNDLLQEFFSTMHPKIPHRYVLVTHNGNYLKGRATPGRYYLFLEDDKILAWFGSNPNIKHPKIVGLPLGLESIVWKNGNIDFYYDAIANYPVEKKHLLYMNFSLKNDPLSRLQVYQIFSEKPYCFIANENGWEKYFQEICESKFVLCPGGRGGDSFRVWESLIFGSVPIVKSSVLDPLYDDLPVVIVQDWCEITEEFLEKKYLELEKKQFCYQKLFSSYWKKRIKEKKFP